jgi:YhcH/YjgK/YiaL family protein
MVFAKLEDAKRYYSLNPRFEMVFDYLNNHDLKKMDVGTYEIDGEDAFLIIAEDQANPDHEYFLEIHRRYIDIQLAIEGEFTIAWKHLDDCKHPQSEFDIEKDAQFFSDTQDFDLKMQAGCFAILFPEDAHGPYPPEEYLKKAIVKVAV